MAKRHAELLTNKKTPCAYSKCIVLLNKSNTIPRKPVPALSKRQNTPFSGACFLIDFRLFNISVALPFDKLIYNEKKSPSQDFLQREFLISYTIAFSKYASDFSFISSPISVDASTAFLVNQWGISGRRSSCTHSG